MTNAWVPTVRIDGTAPIRGLDAFDSAMFASFSVTMPHVGLFAVDSGSGEWLAQTARFWSLQDAAVRTSFAAMLILGVCCGVLGCFVVLRRLSLLSDSLGHAVLPGVCAGFLIAGKKDPWWLFLGAMTAALLGAATVSGLVSRTRLKSDAAMGLVLSGFFAVGALMMSRLQKLPIGGQSGLNQVLFGQASSISQRDLVLIAIMSSLVLIVLFSGYRHWVVTSFDGPFSQSIGYSVRNMQLLFVVLLSMTIVVCIQAVGVVLLSALLITPAVTASLLTQRLPVMIALSATIACVAGCIGLNVSFLEARLPTGPFVVMTLAVIFSITFLLAPRRGLLRLLLQQSESPAQTAGADNPLDNTAISTASRNPSSAGNGEEPLR